MSSQPLEERLVNFFKSEKYRELLREAAVKKRRSIPVEFNDLLKFDEKFATELVNKPNILYNILNRACYRQLQIEDPEYAASVKSFTARIVSLPSTTSIREVRSEHLRKLVMIDGMVSKASAVKPILRTGVFRCRYCGGTQEVEQVSQKLLLPEACIDRTCRGSKRPSFELVPEESSYTDYQVIGVQEKPEDLPPGQLPRVIEMRLRDDLVDVVRPGDRVIGVGIVESQQERAGEGPLKTFRIYLEAVSIEPASKEPQAVHISPEDEKLFKKMAEDPFIINKLVDSVAPSIYGLDHIKKAILLLLMGGRSKIFPDGLRVRGDLNILLVGDPGTAKSQLLQYVASIAPRGIYTSGRGSTAAGLTAAVLREKEGGMVLEAGAMVLADMGVCCIDEIDKMRPEDRVAIHEAMAQQTVSVAKGGIVATLNARTAVLAAANPAFGRYDPYKNFAENINLPITILSRFDLIFVLRDEPNPDVDRKISQHISSLHQLGEPEKPPPIPPETLRKYIAYSKRYEPTISTKALKMLEEFYLKMRSLYETTSTVSITARQFESLIRLTEAHARARLKNSADEDDAASVILLMKKSLQEVGVDIETGKPDIDVIMTGKPRSVREKMKTVIDTIKKFEEKSGYAAEQELRDALKQEGLSEEEITKILTRLITEGRVFMPRVGAYKVT
ncbi:MAG: minichromosome maintenance protein MCM [Candidatus Caldarchaeum sp.]|nr:minichromosome maintenance protein MCM [Candidatus Caldarchaeum sp.]MCS7133707.1 minichromosome maintenance protein MCM [Candidatus Caldarchaeum sp.]MCX8200876.1 minichromosome maintenance protein MCM [Candidatus Caldarchaeum sp.]MDW8062874.1 minichromosome maintenance protein MCM [Candidatus Caldarchaeum sp.]MDW8435351.1 minichromosome maintenance protein MCM [Candidatus Caldarchaeum sp.]